MCNTVNVVDNKILYNKYLQESRTQKFSQKKMGEICELMNMLINLLRGIFSQSVCIPSQQIYPLNIL